MTLRLKSMMARIKLPLKIILSVVDYGAFRI